MSRVLSWWRGLSGATRFRLYSRAALQLSVVSMAAAIGLASPSLLVSVVALGSAIAAVAALEVYPGLTTGPRDPRCRRGIRVGATVISAGLWVYCLIYTQAAVGPENKGQGMVAGGMIILLWALAVGSSLRHRWLALIAGTVITALAYLGVNRDALMYAILLFAVGIAVYFTVQLTVWTLHVVDELEQAKEIEARLRVAEERIRFSRDLHDVVGRGFSAIAVKSELATTLVNAGAAERAAAEMNEVKALAVDSMAQARALVRGYREIDLDSEIAGARSLLAAAGCTLSVAGASDAVPPAMHQAAAGIVREGTTNIVKHSTATSAALTLGAAGMTLSNNGVKRSNANQDGAGLTGLSERLAAAGATLTVDESADEFTLVARWENS